MERIRQFEPLWGVWECEDVLGEGSFGRVYRAVRKDGDRRYYSAIKHISVPASEQQLQEIRSSGCHNNDVEVSRYFNAIIQDVKREIDFMYTLRGNANIVSYEDHLMIPKPTGIGCDIFIRMELLTDLNSITISNFSPQEAVKVGVDICTALEVCGRAGILHRDIKPSNIFITNNGECKLGDFGIAKVLDNTTVGMSKKGTYSYMAPEIYKCEPANRTSDIYSLGIVLYKLLNDNRLPFLPVTGTIYPHHQEEALLKTMNGTPMPPPKDAPPALANVILKACSYNKRNRFQSPTEFKNALISALSAPTAQNRAAGFSPMPPAATVAVNTAPADFPAAYQMPAAKESGARKKVAALICILLAMGLILGGLYFYRGMKKGDSAQTTGSSYSETDSSDKTDALRSYQEALDLMSSGQYKEAIATLKDISSTAARYSDDPQFANYEENLNYAYYLYAGQLLDEESWDDAKNIYLSLGEFSDSNKKAVECDYKKAMFFYSQGSWGKAKNVFSSIRDHSDSKAYTALCNFHLEKEKESHVDSVEDINELRTLFRSLHDYADTNDQCKAACADPMFTLLKLCDREYSNGDEYINLYSDSNGLHTSLKLSWFNESSYWWYFDDSIGEFGIFSYKTSEDNSYIQLFEVIGFDNSYSEAPASITVRSMTDGTRYTFYN